MPLKPGSSKATVSQNIREFHTGKTYAHTASKFGKERANKQAIAVALSTARKYRRADGGAAPGFDKDWAFANPDLAMQRAQKDPAYSRAMDLSLGINQQSPSPPPSMPQRIMPTILPNGMVRGMRTGGAPQKAAMGGMFNFENMIMRGSSYNLRHEGMINSAIPGRTDKLPMNVKSGSYILPADIPSALGQGNTMAGGQILKKMFTSGPYGLGTMHGGSRVSQPRMNFVRPPSMGSMGRMGKMGGFAAGGTKSEQESESHVPIIAAGGEFIIHPDVVRDIGHGDIKAGHRVLDQFVLSIRKKNIDTLKKLKPPKK